MEASIIGTALFGSPALSERAFRLLRWIRNRPSRRHLRPVISTIAACMSGTASISAAGLLAGPGPLSSRLVHSWGGQAGRAI